MTLRRTSQSRSAFAQTSSNSTVTISGAQPNLAAYKTAWTGAYSGNDQVKELLAVRAMTQYYKKNPNASWDKLVWAADAFRRKYEAEALRGETPQYRDTMKLVDRYALGVAVFGALPSAAPLATEAYNKFIKEPIEKQWEPINRFEAIRAQEAYWSELRGKEEEVLDGALGLRTDPDFAKAMDAQYGSTTGLSVGEIGTTNVYGKLVENLTGVPETVKNKLRGAIKPDGTLSISKDELRGILKEVLGGVEGKLGTLEIMMNETLATAKRIEDQQKDILAWIANEEKQRQEQALRQAEAQRHQLVIEGANSVVYLVSTLVSLGGDKVLANQISVVGSSAIQIYDAVEKFVDALPELSKLGNLAVGLSGAIMTGNVVGAVMNVVSLFADQGPTPEQMILDQIGRLQEQVGRMHQQMHDRFDRVEKQLDAIYGGINAIFDLVSARFNQIANDLDSVRRDVDAIQQELARQEAHLSRLGQGLHEGLQEGFRQPLVEAVNGAIGYKARTGTNMSPGTFGDYENKFYSWAVNFAKEQNEQPLAGRSYADDDVLSELERYELEENVMYLSNWLQRKAGLPALSTSSLPNPVTWAVSARAHAELRVENPKYAASAGYTNRAAAVENEGNKVRLALRRITTKSNGSSGPEPNHELFDWLIATNYSQKVGDLDVALRDVESKYLSDWKKLTIQRGDGEPDVDPWGDAQQSIAYKPSFPSDAPSNIASFIPAPYVLAEYVRLDDPGLSVSMAPEWTEEREEDVPLRDGWSITRVFAKLLVNVIVKYAGTSFLARHVVGDEEMKIMEFKYDSRGLLVSDWMLDINTAFNKNWTTGQNLKARFEAGSQETSPTTIVRDVVNRVEDKLRELRSGICSKTLTEFGDGQSLYAPARRLDGAKALVDRFVNLGMPLALESDDFLRAMLYGTQSLVDRGQALERYLATKPRAPLGHYVSLRSHNFPTRFVRHRNYLGEISEVHSDLDKQDSTFRMVPGLVDAGTGTISLESMNFPGHYLVQNAAHRLELRQLDAGDPNFKSNATFSVVEGLAAPGGVSFRSHGNPANYIRHYNFKLWAQSGSDDLFRQDATFHVTLKDPRGFVKRDAEARADALHKALKGYLDLIGTKKWGEEQPMIRSMLLRSRAIDVVVKVLNADTKPPTVSSVRPANGATGVRRNANLTATFSEKMNKRTLNKSTFKLYKVSSNGSTTQVINTTVTPSTDGLKATLNPFGKSSTLLAKNTKYKAVITPGAKDLANNALDQDPTKAGNQQKVWTFKTGLR